MRPRKIICIDTGQEYEAIADIYKVNKSITSSAIKSQRVCGGFRYRYKEDVELKDPSMNKNKKVVDLYTNRVYSSIQEASNSLNMTRYNITNNNRFKVYS